MISLFSFFDELEKIAAEKTADLALSIPKNLLKLYSGGKRMMRGEERNREYRDVVENQGYPAGWVALGIRPEGMEPPTR